MMAVGRWDELFGSPFAVVQLSRKAAHAHSFPSALLPCIIQVLSMSFLNSQIQITRTNDLTLRSHLLPSHYTFTYQPIDKSSTQNRNSSSPTDTSSTHTNPSFDIIFKSIRKTNED